MRSVKSAWEGLDVEHREVGLAGFVVAVARMCAAVVDPPEKDVTDLVGHLFRFGHSQSHRDATSTCSSARLDLIDTAQTSLTPRIRNRQMLREDALFA